MRLNLLALLVVSMTCLSHAQQSAQQPSEIRAENCMVQYINKVDIAATAEGLVTQLTFEEGDAVNVGDTMAVIEDTAAKLAVELKRAEEKEALLTANNDVNLRDAQEAAKVAAAEAKSFEKLLEQGAIPFWEVEKKRLEAGRQELRIELAEMEQKVAQIKMIGKGSELEMARFELTKRTITAPYTGIIEARMGQRGQWVQPGTPMATLIQMDKLRVEGDIDALRYAGQVMKGTPVDVLIHNQAEADKGTRVQGKLGFVSMEIDLNKNYRVWVEIENRKVGDDWMFKPGMRAEVVIRPSGQSF